MVDVPERPEADYQVEQAIAVFCMATRSRQYAGFTATPMPITVANITDVVVAHDIMIPRSILDACVFAIDDAWLKALEEDKQDGGTDVEPPSSDRYE